MTLKNESGAILGVGVLSDGDVIARLETEPLPHCVFLFTISDVPPAQFYTFAAGRHGDVTFSHEELEDQDWSPVLTLGQ